MEEEYYKDLCDYPCRGMTETDRKNILKCIEYHNDILEKTDNLLPVLEFTKLSEEMGLSDIIHDSVKCFIISISKEPHYLVLWIYTLSVKVATRNLSSYDMNDLLADFPYVLPTDEAYDIMANDMLLN